MHGEPPRPKASDERQARTNSDNEHVDSAVVLAPDVDLTILGRTHERIEEFSRPSPRLVFVAAEEPAAARALGRGAHTHRAHVRGEGNLGEQENHEDNETLDEDRRHDLRASLGMRVRFLKSSPSHG